MSYISDMTDNQWRIIQHNFKSRGNYGNRSKYDKRILVNAVFYIIKTGCQWRMLPKDFPPYSTVHTFYRRCRMKRIWKAVMKELVEKDRMQNGSKAEPSYSIIDSQSIKTTSASEKIGIDGNKKIKGHKRHIVTDTQGHILQVKVHEANIHDTVSGCEVFKEALEEYPSILGVCADEGYRKTMKNYVEDVLKKL